MKQYKKRISKLLRNQWKQLTFNLVQKMPESKLKTNILAKKFNVINNIVVITGQNCSLKCRDCANFSPYLSKILPFYPYEEIIADIEELTKEAKIAYLQLQGGEFFLHPNHEEILAYIAQNKRIIQVTIATNATIIPKDSVLMLIKQSGKISLRLSGYGEANEKSANKMEVKLQTIGIPYQRHKFLGEFLWSQCGEINMQKLSEKNMQTIFDKCVFARNCLTMENGFITRCSRATIAHIAQNFSLQSTDGIFVRPSAIRAFNTLGANTGGGGVTLSKKPFTYKNLKQFIDEHTPITACYYCYGTEGKKIQPGIQLTKEELQKLKQKD